MKKVTVYSHVISAALLCVPAVAHAQGEGGGAENPGASDSPRGIGNGTIVVTANKREQLLRDVPASIAAFDSDQLEKQAITSTDELVRLVPGVVLQSAQADTNRIIFRGISPASKGAPNQTSQVMFGDVPFIMNYAPRFLPDPLPFDISSVEVLKGPQGTLFGSGSLNGSVRYIYNDPEIGRLGGAYMGRLTAIEDGDADFLVAGMVNVPLGDIAAVRVSGYTGRDPGYIDNITPGFEEKDINWRDRDAIRGAVTVRPSDRFDATLSYLYEESYRNGTPVSDNFNGEYTNSNLQLTGFDRYDYSVGELEMAYHFDNFDLVSITGLIDTSAAKVQDLTPSIIGNTTPAASGGYINAAIDRGVKTDVFFQEIRLVSTDSSSPFSWVVGVNYSREKSEGVSTLENFSATNTIPPQIPPPFGLGYVSLTDDFVRLQWDIEIEEISAFADVTYKLFDDKLELSVGGRYYRYDTVGVTTNQGGLIELTNGQLPNDFNPGPRFVVTNSADQSEDGFNPKASITFRPNDSIMAYVSASRGFRLGGIQSGWSGAPLIPGIPAPQPPQYVESDYLWNYEAGIRTSMVDDRLLFDVSAYHLEWKNAQFTVSDPVAGAFFTDNIAQVEGDGVEVSVVMIPTPGLTFSASTAYSDIRTASDITTITLGTAPAGTQWPGSFEWQTAVSLDYDGNIGDLGFKAGTSYTSLSGGASDDLFKVAAGVNNDISYQIVNAYLGIQLDDVPSSPQLMLTVRNLFNDKSFAANLTDASIAGIPYDYVTYVQPRSFVLTLSGSF